MIAQKPICDKCRRESENSPSGLGRWHFCVGSRNDFSPMPRPKGVPEKCPFHLEHLMEIHNPDRPLFSGNWA